MSQLTVEKIGHRFGQTDVLKNISFALERGELLSILGASGSGKTTLLRSIAGFVAPQEGRISIGNVSVHAEGNNLIPTEKRNVGMVFQDHSLFPHMTVEENIQFGISTAADRHERCEELLALMGLEGFGPRLPATLSGGQRQRVALARALAPKPHILLLDEPFANLDANLQSTMVVEVRKILKQEEITALMVTHDKDDALVMADRVAILDAPNSGARSSLVQVDTPEQVYERPASAAAARLTGAVSFIAAVGQGAVARNELGDVPLVETVEGPCTLCLRPENLGFQESPEGNCVLTHKKYLGHQTQWTVQTPCGEVLLYAQTKTP